MKKGKYPIVISIILGAIAGILVSMVFAAVCALMIQNGSVRLTLLAYLVPVIHVLSSYIGSALSKTVTTGKKSITALLTGVAYILLLLIINLMFAGGRFDGALLACVCIMIGSAAAAFLFCSAGKRRGIHKHKVRIR